MELGVLSHPGIAVVNIDHVDLLKSDGRKDHKPLLQKFRSEAILRARVGEVNHDVVAFVKVRFQAQNDFQTNTIFFDKTNK